MNTLIILITTFYVCMGIFNIKVYNHEYYLSWACKVRSFFKNRKFIIKLSLFLLGFLPLLFFMSWGVLVLIFTFYIYVMEKLK